ncbi:hypothetical protein NDU88_010626 [Pleurodeles waltl]|uniref:Uncharacterized protein n=1 Tax=Pleurodeles waltl TaxID=8319 RepID=A0AAV7S072_PLEWA|nr:hypothetical protein NDU88_010626 [Pleurodeles waltl]
MLAPPAAAEERESRVGAAASGFRTLEKDSVRSSLSVAESPLPRRSGLRPPVERQPARLDPFPVRLPSAAGCSALSRSFGNA